jgi:hypothetical protein
MLVKSALSFRYPYTPGANKKGYSYRGQQPCFGHHFFDRGHG